MQHLSSSRINILCLALDIWSLIGYYLNPEDFLTLLSTCQRLNLILYPRISTFRLKKLDQALYRMLAFFTFEGCLDLFNHCCEHYGALLSGSLLIDCIRDDIITKCNIILYIPRLAKPKLAFEDIRNRFNSRININAHLEDYLYDIIIDNMHCLRGTYMTLNGNKLDIFIIFTHYPNPVTYIYTYANFSYDFMYTNLKSIIMDHFWSLSLKAISMMHEPCIGFKIIAYAILEKYKEKGYEIKKKSR